MAGYVYRPTYRDKETGEKKESSVWWIGYSIDGKKQRESAKTTSKREAEDLLHKRLADRGQAPAQRRAEKTTFEDLCELIRRDYKRNNRKSLQRLNLSIKHLSGFFSEWIAPAIDRVSVERYVDYRLEQEKPEGQGEGTYSPATVNRELAALKRMLTLAHERNMIQRVPAISTLKEDNARKGFFSEKDLQAVLEELHPELRPLVETAYITGWRKSELLSRDWRHVDFDAGWIRLDPGESKSGEGRQFPMTDRLRGVLEGHRATKRLTEKRLSKVIKPLFFRYDGYYQGQRVRNFYKAWSQALEDAGMPDRIFHDFRRTAVRNLVRAGVPEKVAMELTGHKTREVFDRYNIVSEGMLKDAGRTLDRMHASEGG